MKNVTFYIKNLVIHRMPGFARGMAPLKLAKNINLITGPNASGKSSTSRIIQKVIWPFQTKGLDVDAQLEIDDDLWQVKIDSESVRVQQDGIDKKLNGIPSKEGCHRYLLPLHDLIKENEDDLAREIMKASIGGYDLDEAHNNLDYSRTIKNSSASEFKEVSIKDREYKEIIKNHKELKNEEETLRNLETDRSKAKKASLLYKFYKALSEWKRAELTSDNLAILKDQYPASMDNISGEELTAIEDLEIQIADAEDGIDLTENNIEKEKKKINDLQISGLEISETILTNLENRLHNLNEITHKIKDLETDLFAKHEERCEAVKAIDESLDPLEWARLDLELVKNLDEFTKNAYRVLGLKVNLENEKNRLQEELENLEDVPFEPENVLQGVNFLGSWIKEQEIKVDLPVWVIPVLAFVGALTALATLLFGWPGLIGILFIVGLVFYALQVRSNASSNSIREKDFKDLGLPLPSQWNLEEVTSHINVLFELLRKSKIKNDTHLRVRQLNLELKNLSPEIDNIQNDQRKWREEIGSVPNVNENDFGSLYWFIRNARDWQKAHVAYKSLEGEKVSKEKQLADELKEFNSLLQQCNLQTANNQSEADAELKNLKKQLGTKKEALVNISNLEVQLKTFRKNKNGASEKLSSIYRQLIVAQGDKNALKDLIERLADYKDLSQNLFASKQKLLEKENELKGQSLFEELKETTKNLSLDEIEEKTKENEEISGELEEISEKITRIETLINDKKKGHELEDILTEKHIALEGLVNLYQNNLTSVTGNLIVEKLKTETRDQNRPQVFKRANILFNKITNGRYELRLDDNDNPSFKAYDTIYQQGLTLSEVSTGTRVQLLLAVRLAYVESQESGIKLPILADELLANSDDERATAIIKALIEISKEGRQVFYFTAQADEVYKWQSILKDEIDLDYETIKLQDHSEQAEEPFTTSKGFRFKEEVPEPGENSHEELW